MSIIMKHPELQTQNGNKVAKKQQVLIGQLLLIITIGLIVTVKSKWDYQIILRISNQVLKSV